MENKFFSVTYFKKANQAKFLVPKDFDSFKKEIVSKFKFNKDELNDLLLTCKLGGDECKMESEEDYNTLLFSLKKDIQNTIDCELKKMSDEEKNNDFLPPKNLILKEEQNEDNNQKRLERRKRILQRMEEKIRKEKIDTMNQKLNQITTTKENEKKNEDKIKENKEPLNFSVQNIMRGIQKELNKRIDNILEEKFKQVKREIVQKVLVMSESMARGFISKIPENSENIPQMTTVSPLNSENYNYKCITKERAVIINKEDSNRYDFELIIENSSQTTWPENKAMLICNSELSEIRCTDILLPPLEWSQRCRVVAIFRNLQSLEAKTYTSILDFVVDGKKYGEPILLSLTLDIIPIEFIINEMRERYSLSREEFPDDILKKALKKSKNDIGQAFQELYDSSTLL